MSVEMHQVVDSTPEIELTNAAIQHIISYLNKKPGQAGVRFSVKKTGCSGMAYVVDYVDQALEHDLRRPLNERYQAYIDKSSYPFLKHVQVDYVKQGLNYKFVFKNPNQTGQCGCGESFTVA